MFSLSIILGKGQYWVKKKRWLEQIVQMLKSGQLSFLSASGVDLAGTGVKGLPGTAPVADPETSQVTTAID